MLHKLLFRPTNYDTPKHSVSSTRKQSYPFYIKASLVLIGLYLLFMMLQILQDILVPICFALLVSILLNPLVNRFIRMNMPRVLAISVALTITVVAFAGVVLFLSNQLSSFSELAPQLTERTNQIIADAQQWVTQSFGISQKKQEVLVNEAMESSKAYIGSTLMTIADIVSTFILLPIYIFLIMYYKPMFINFFYEVFDYKHGQQVSDVLTETKSAIQSYIIGLLVETGIVAVLNSVALLIIGVEYAILIGVIGALLNLIPYIGGLVAIALPVSISLVTQEDMSYTTPLIIIAAYVVIQFIDNNIIVPRVVSSKVEVNALISIIIVLMGGALWGVSGMFLSIPFVAILKIIFDRIDELKPWGMLLGTSMNTEFSLSDIGTQQAQEKSILSEEIEDSEFSENTSNGLSEESLRK